MNLNRIVLAVSAVVLLSACSGGMLDTEPEAWARAQESKDTDGYYRYVANFPRGTHVHDAEWALAQINNNTYGYSEFLRRFPDSAFAPEAQRRLAEVAWAKAKQLNTSEAYRVFLQQTQRPTPYDAQAQELAREANYEFAVKQLPASLEHARGCFRVRDSPLNCSERLRVFARDYPATDKGREVAAWTAQIEQEYDDAAFQKATDPETYERLLAYMAEYPEGSRSLAVKKMIAAYSWQTLKAPWTLSWKSLGKYLPLDSKGLLQRQVEIEIKMMVLIKGCTTGNRPVALEQLQFVQQGSRFPGGPDVVPIRGTLSATEAGGIDMLELDNDGSCVVTVGFDQFVSVGSHFRIKPTKNANGEVNQLRFFGYFAREGEVTIVPDGMRFETGSVVLRRH